MTKKQDIFEDKKKLEIKRSVFVNKLAAANMKEALELTYAIQEINNILKSM